ncbi:MULTISPECIES: hypothetical protein [Yersinia]|uniref:Uncharacterized protein n=1 Tax=Yersinia bercovieri ATCC 43970 TaxID=349968 RepID=A0ABP2E4C2_YERBE|nr:MULTISPECIES: hypothetical protein [Yersinia]EEQ05830.1 hypothetical protein yberc0001_36150 [Yersinia bercovieri ATCC 43970]QKJ09162.1 hypothetical protein HRK25_19750 [Yersinia bercovieri ATCC 43970]UZX70279.1 hypothetical protein ND437_16855 [Yersinia ruckeri]HEN3646973.1 hypothetical protein [Yersinia enterocolitica]
MARLSFERKKLLYRTADALSVAYDNLESLSSDEVREFIEGGDITVAALAYVTGLQEDEIIEEAVKQAKKRELKQG